MADSDEQGVLWYFSNLCVDEKNREVRVVNEVVALERKPLDVLLCLLRAEGELLTKQELFEQVWAGRIVTDGVLNQAIRRIREILGDSTRKKLRTVHGLGFRLDGPIRVEGRGRPGTRLSLQPGDFVPHATSWRLLNRLSTRLYHELWRAQHTATQEVRVFKFAVNERAERALKREVTINRVLLKTSPNAVVPILQWQLNKAPFHISLPWMEMGALDQWAAGQCAPLKPVDLAQCVGLIQQVAKAASAAHELGILHRDIKPGNVLLEKADDGLVARLCDFGSGSIRSREQLQSGEITIMGFTRTQQTNSQSGTTAYLAPEIVADGQFSERSDVYALGVLLFQLASGHLRRPLAPGWEQDLPDDSIRDIVRQACAGHIQERTASMHELAKQLAQWCPQPSSVPAAAHRPDYRKSVWGALGLCITVAVSWWLLPKVSVSGPPSNPATATKMSQLTFRGDVRYAKISPDGTHLATVESEQSGQVLTVKELNSQRTQKLYSADHLYDLAWSPDGQKIAISEDSADGVPDVHVVPLDGRPALSLGQPYCAMLDWFPDNRRLACAEYIDHGFTILDTQTQARTVYELALDFATESALAVSPDGQWLVLAGARNDGSGAIWRVRANGTELALLQELRQPTAEIDFDPQGDRLYYLDRFESKLDLKALDIDASNMRPHGSPWLLQDGLMSGPAANSISPSYRSSLSISSAGDKLVYTRFEMHAYLHEWPLLESARDSQRAAKRITQNTGVDQYPALSPDGRFLAFRRRQGRNDNLFLLERETGGIRQLSQLAGLTAAPGWSPDSQELAFVAKESGEQNHQPRVWLLDVADGNLTELAQSQPLADQNTLRWSPDGRILYTDTQHRLRSIRRDGQDERAFAGLAAPYVQCPLFSPVDDSILFTRSIFAGEDSGLWIKTGQESKEQQLIQGGHPCPLAYTPDSQRVLISDLSRLTIGEWDLAKNSWKMLYQLPFRTGFIVPVDYSQTPPLLISSHESAFSDAWVIAGFNPSR